MKEVIMKINELMDTSPILKRTSGNNSPVLKRSNDVLMEIREIIQGNKDNLGEKIKVVLIGEVKAGKSTLINSILGERVAYMNVLEATATIMEIKYGQEHKVIIVKENEEDEVLESLEVLNTIYNEKKDDMEYFNNVASIHVFLTNPILKELTLVDTPGLRTITKQNEEKTNKYIYGADVILWVMNANHIGQSDIEERIDDLMDFGKPMVLALNRVDEVNSGIESLVEYVDSEIGYAVDNNIFPVSGKKCLEALETNKDDVYKRYGVGELVQYIKLNIEGSEDITMETIIQESLKTQLHREKQVHINTKINLEKIYYELEKEMKSIESYNDNLKDKIDNKLKNWLEYEFMIGAKNSVSGLSNKKSFDSACEKHFNEENINNEVIDGYNGIAKYINGEWKVYSEQLIKSFRGDSNIVNMIEVDKAINLTQLLDEANIADSATKGGITAGAVGLGLAVYSALLGPSAAAITIGAATSVILPPFLIVGVIGGATYKWLHKDEVIKDRTYKLKDMIDDVKRSVKKNTLPKMEEDLKNVSDLYSNEIKNNVVNIISQGGLSFEDFKTFISKVDEYIKKVDELNNEIQA